MKVVYSERFAERYTTNPVESPDRARLPARELAGYEFVDPPQASLEDVSRIHSREHIERVRRKGMLAPALLAAGGACRAAELALGGEAAFALVRPPGHHAASDHAWGMCYLNNIAIAVRMALNGIGVGMGWEAEGPGETEMGRRRGGGSRGRVLIVDIDLHFGDGTVSIFRWDERVRIANVGAIDPGFDYLTLDPAGYISQVERAVAESEFDLLAVSAGFDTYLLDWGGLLDLADYREIGRVLKEGAEERCRGRRFAVLEGGYHQDLRLCVKSFVRGFE
ncbi:MAG: histone deacetylase family protein [Methanothrix sp.]|nr:histone deacetylase family protein [Methanothrix sp.]OPX81909.1 MAG: Histone deacetylase domain protein [Methanosaeta sp. PtaB.Bin087]HOI69664.1 histone deacetylase family protein [Methanothrix sp.]